jgi:phage terminase large subunit
VSSLKNKTLEIQTPEWALPLFEPCRYKAAFGGRGSGKSHMFAEMLIEEHIMNPNQSSVCVREIQKSLNQSVKRLLELKIEELNAGEFFEVQDAVIKSRRGNGRIIFQGMQNHTADSIKSLEGYDRAWVEEAQSLSQQSLDLLRPTIRKPGSNSGSLGTRETRRTRSTGCFVVTIRRLNLSLLRSTFKTTLGSPMS